MCKLLLLLIMQVLMFQTLTAQQEANIAFHETFEGIKEILMQSEKEDVISRKKAKLDQVLVSFLETDFMNRFKEMRLEAEALVATFKSYQDSFSPSEVSRVKKAYSMIADKYNLLLNEIKMGLLDRKKLKTIKDNPKMYSDALKNNLRELREEYARNFEREIFELTGDDTYSLGSVMAILGILKFCVEFTDYLSQIRINARKVKEEHLNTFLIEPFRFKAWEKIEASAGDIQPSNKSEDNQQERSQGLNPFGEEN